MHRSERESRIFAEHNTFGHRLKAAGVSLEDRRILLGHGKANVTDNYSLPDIARLIQCVGAIEKRRETVILRPLTRAKDEQSARRNCDARESTA
jgi:hypothetical protein